MGLTNKQQAFVTEYLRDFNATQAAIRAGYSPKTAYSIGQENLKKPEIAQAISAAIAARSMGADEVLLRLAAIARGDIADLLDIHATGYNLALMVRDNEGNQVVNPKTSLIRKIKQKTTMIMSERGDDREITETEIELYSALEALQALGKAHVLFTDRTQYSGEVKIVWDYQPPSSPPSTA